MFRKSVLASVLASTLFAAQPVAAYQDTFDRRSDVTAGVFLRIPLTGGMKLRDTKQPFEYGFRLNVSDRYQSFSGVRSKTYGFEADALNLRFGPDGFDNIAVSGFDVIEYGPTRLSADGTEEEKEGGVNWWLVGGGVAALVVVGGIAARESIENSFEDIFRSDGE